MFRVFVAILGAFTVPSLAMAYDPLITSTTFDTLKSDVNLTVLAVLSIFMVIAGVGFIIRGMFGR